MCYCNSKNLYKPSNKKYQIKDTDLQFSDKRSLKGAYDVNNKNKFIFDQLIENRTIQLPHSIDSINMQELIEKPEIFLNYYHKNIPLIINNAINDWPALQKWDNNYLSQTINQKITIDITPDGFADSIKNIYFVQPYQIQGNFQEFLRYKEKKVIFILKNMVAYIQKQCGNLDSEFKDLINDIDQKFKQFFSKIFESEPDACNFWMGQQESVSSMHKDPYENLYSVIQGEKHFTLIPPKTSIQILNGKLTVKRQNLKKNFLLKVSKEKLRWISLNPDMDDIPQLKNHKYHIILKKGQVLYLPSLWYHQVAQHSDSDEYVIAVNYWWDMQYGSNAHCLYNLLRDIVLNSD